MIRLSRLADYAFVLLTQMARQGPDSCSASALAERTSLPLPTVSKLLKILAKQGLIQAQRGAAGGYRMVRLPSHIAVASVIEAVDGPIALTECVDDREPHCVVESVCPMHGGWNKINQAVRTALATVTLADMMLPVAPPLGGTLRRYATAPPLAQETSA